MNMLSQDVYEKKHLVRIYGLEMQPKFEEVPHPRLCLDWRRRCNAGTAGWRFRAYASGRPTGGRGLPVTPEPAKWVA